MNSFFMAKRMLGMGKLWCRNIEEEKTGNYQFLLESLHFEYKETNLSAFTINDKIFYHPGCTPLLFVSDKVK